MVDSSSEIPRIGPDEPEPINPNAQRYAFLLGAVRNPDRQTPDFNTSGLVGRRILGFYALFLENEQLSIGFDCSDNDAEKDITPKRQIIDIHPGWLPFDSGLLELLVEWAGVPSWEQNKAREAAETLGLTDEQPPGDNVLFGVFGVNERYPDGRKWGREPLE